MLICKEFVVLNMPKTGSTFVRTVIMEIYRRRAERAKSCGNTPKGDLLDEPPRELILPNINVPGRPHDQHGTYRQIPEEVRNRPVLSVARNLYDKFLSTFEFRFWAEYPPLQKQVLLHHFPDFPNLSLDDYVLMNELSAQHKIPGRNLLNVGNQTIQFIRMYFKKPSETLAKLTPDYLESSDAYENDIADIIFLKQDNLNEELAQFLIRMGYTQEEAELCRTFRRVNVTPNKCSDRNTLWTTKAIHYVQHNERFLFRMLANRGITFPRPEIVDGRWEICTKTPPSIGQEPVDHGGGLP